MPSPFDDIDAAMQADIDRLFGEGISIIPQLGDEYTRIPDPDRPVKSGIRATIARAATGGATDYRGSARDGASLSASTAEMWIDRAAYAALGYRLVRGDIVELSDETPPPRFVVAAVNDGDGGDVQVILG
ncbi:MAG: hypothetical protein BGO05_05435 [Rhizobiales bacterium 63-7]|nr:hypothetical protein [Hyphomicrobiales bacterium]OJU66645.1 MAG: hypothetical protein BGO05_05435 [Rhizobiales bacterium 63-7]